MERLVGDLGECRLVLRMPQHAIELCLLPSFGRGLQFGRPLLQQPQVATKDVF